MPSLEVHSYHININYGDSAVHLLVDTEGYPRDRNGTTIKIKGAVQRAILIDGGTSNLVLSTILDQIDAFYDFPPHPHAGKHSDGKNYMMFDSVVVTHWDNDHYGGVIYLIEHDLEELIIEALNRENIKKPVKEDFGNKEEAFDKATEAWLEQARKVAPSVRSRYLKYDDDKDRTPLTTFYSPYWKDGWQLPQTDGLRVDSSSSKTAVKAAQAKVPSPDLKAVFSDPDHPDDPSRHDPTKPVRLSWHIKVINTWVIVCNLVAGHDALLGMELFTHKSRPTEPPFDQIDNVDVLVYVHELFIPGVYCIAADSYRLGSSTRVPRRFPITSETDPPRRTQTAASELASSVGVPEVVNRMSTSSNMSSIVCIVAWPLNSSNQSTVTHYFGGDVGAEVEEQLVTWMPSKIPVMKLGHHGAAESTPTDMLDKLDPTAIIVSAGDNSAWKHPSWETVMYLDAFQRVRIAKAKAKSKGELAAMVMPLLCTSYPIYFLKRVEEASWDYCRGVGETSAFDDTPDINPPNKNDPVAVFQSSITKLYNQVGENLLTEYQKLPKTGATRQNWLLEKLEETWQTTLSSQPPSTLEISGAYTSAKKPQMSSRDNLVQYIVARQTSTGCQVAYKLNGETSERSQSGYPKSDGNDKRDESHQIVNVDVDTSMLFTATVMPALSKVTNLSSSSSSSPSSNIAIGSDTLLANPSTLPDSVVGTGEDVVIVTDLQRQKKATTSPGIATKNLIIFSSAYAGIVPTTLSAGTLDNFVMALNSAAIVLNGTSLTTAANSEPAVVPNDDWMAWMATAASNATGIFVAGQDTTPSSFRLEIAIPVPESPAGPSTPPSWIVTFNTLNWKAAFGTSVVLNNLGILTIQNSMIFSLDTGSINTTLGQVFQVFNMANSLTGLADDLGLELDVSQGSRNAVWFLPSFNYKTTLRLQFQVNPTDQTRLQSVFQSVLGQNVTIDSPVVIARKSTVRTDVQYDSVTGQMFMGRMTPQIIVGATVADAKANLSMSAYLQFEPNNCELILFFNSPLSLDAALDWLFGILDIHVFSLSSLLPMKIDVTLRRVSITIDKNLSIIGFSLACELDLALGVSDPNSTVKFDLAYQYPEEIFTGVLWTQTPPELVFPADYSLTAEYEKYQIIFPNYPTTQAAQPGLSLVNLHPGNTISTPPSGLHPMVVAATIEIDPVGTSFTGFVNIVQNSSAAPHALTVPTIALAQADFSASYQFATETSPSSFTATLSMEITLKPKDPKGLPVTVIGSVGYDSSSTTWTFDGRLLGMDLSTLYSLFDSKCSDALSKVLGNIRINYLDIMHNYDSTGAASDLTVTGVIILDILELDLTYTHNGHDWKFTAQIETTSTVPKTTTLGLIVSDICGSDIAAELPSFVANMQLDTAIPSSKPLISMVTASTSGDTPHVLFELTVNLGDDFSISFVQIHSTKAAATDEPKRAIKLTVQPLPGVDSVPLVGHLDQPLPAMDFIWVHDAGGQGLTRDELSLINSEAQVTLLYKDTVPAETQKGTDVVICTGLHFIVYESSDIILDYNSQSQTSQLAAPKAATPPDQSVSSDSNTAAMAPWKKTIGPLTISNVGLHLKGTVLWIYFDASCNLGPIGLSLLGLGLGFDFAGITLNDLTKLAGHIKLNFNGLAVGFNEPPVSLAGIFERQGPESYVGGIVLGLDPYSFLAVGSYGNIAYGNSNFKSVFVFARLDGPLLNLEVAEVTGVKAGFGYNSSLKYPDVSQVLQFPFVTNALTDETTDPIALLRQICGTPDNNSGWITPKDGPFWLAAGLDLTAFEVINASAVVTIAFSPAVSIGLFADVIASMPAGATPQGSFLYAELGLLSTIDFIHGTMITEGQLSPNSFVLHPSCHLSGGFAMCYWFTGSGHVGDWVYTVGGYASAYTAQIWYPKVERLGISWSLDSSLSVTGEAYFAITPKVCMGGGSLAAVFNCGPLGAHFNAYADFLINYRPFFFQGDIGVNVGVDFTLDLFFFSIHIGVDISASLHLQGPPFGGVVHVDFYLFGFDVHFGDDSDEKPKLKLDQFIDLLHQSSTPDDSAGGWSTSNAVKSSPPRALSADSRRDFILTLEKGAVQTQGKSTRVPEDAQWAVHAGSMQFRVSGVFAMTSAACNELSAAPSKVALDTKFYSKPMQVTETTSLSAPMRVTIRDDQNFLNTLKKPFRITAVTKNVPTALWGPYNSLDDPSVPNQEVPSDLLKPDSPTMELIMGLDVAAPEPTLSQDNIPTFNAVAEMSRNVFCEDPANPGHPFSQPSTIPYMPSDADPQTLWIPVVSPHAGTPQAWEDVKAVWQAPEADPQYIVDAWSEVFGWDQGDASDLVGKVPKLLMAEFDDLYMACPLMPDSDLIGK